MVNLIVKYKQLTETQKDILATIGMLLIVFTIAYLFPILMG